MARYHTLLVCTNQRDESAAESCAGRGSEALLAACREAVQREGLDLDVKSIQCFGYCSEGPNARLIPAGPFFHHLDEAGIVQILREAAQA